MKIKQKLLHRRLAEFIRNAERDFEKNGGKKRFVGGRRFIARGEYADAIMNHGLNGRFNGRLIKNYWCFSDLQIARMLLLYKKPKPELFREFVKISGISRIFSTL